MRLEVDVIVKMRPLIMKIMLLDSSNRSGVEEKSDEGDEVIGDVDKAAV